MLYSIWMVSALCATALSAPTLTFSSDAAARPVEMKVLSEYFQMLGSKVQEGKKMAQAPVCNMNNAVMPVASPKPLPPPTAGLVLKHVAIGRGTQNYSCGANQTAAPVALGALATLYNASCVASTYPTLLAMLPNVALQFNLTTTNQATLSPSNLAISGHHYFSNASTPTFNLDTPSLDLGFAPCSKNASVSAPAGAPVGQDNKGNGAVAWLKLLTIDGATGGLEEIYRVNTAGGNPPATCAGMPATFEVQYAAEYWFYES
ncbi:hypothetical protein D0Z07_1298 [Hyphodiscus hymeniophilus]|uniref:Malate dehydrogenase n=1 Tax=Hyphodiscus hymeniophilus TaxID=353542 RepID=A0A9P6VQP8_9HELO|nr:hypothetical protein D0Z07_1298 [Hyphodiscus hymeniophilus]